MKKKKWLFPVIIAGGLIVLCILLLVVAVCIIGIKGYGISKGRLYFAEKHTYLIDDRDMAMLVSDQSKKGNLFHCYDNGDEVLIVHDGVEETYYVYMKDYPFHALINSSCRHYIEHLFFFQQVFVVKLLSNLILTVFGRL